MIVMLDLLVFSLCGWALSIKAYGKLLARQSAFYRKYFEDMQELFQQHQRLSLDLMKQYEPEQYERACAGLAELHTRDILRRNKRDAKT